MRRNIYKPASEIEETFPMWHRKGMALARLHLTLSSLLRMFSSRRKCVLNCFYTSARDLRFEAASFTYLPVFSLRLGWGLDTLPQQLVQAQCFPANVLPCCSECRHTSINSNKAMYLTNKTGTGALTPRHQS